MNDWYNKTKTPFFILSAITLVLLFSGRKVNFGQNINTTYHIFTIEFQYFGMDSSQLEKIITIPLEEKINEISGLCEMRTVTEQGKVSLTAWFSKSISSKKIYLTLRNYVDTLYRQLPSAVQKPRILSSESTSKAVFCFTVSSEKDLTNLRQYIENTIKKKLEGVSGVAEVIVSGGALKEIQIKFDVPNLVEKNLNPQVFAQIVQDANVIYAGSTLHGSNDMTVQFDTKIQTIEQLEKLPVKLNSGYVTAGDLAEFDFCDNKQKEIVRINGEEAVAVQVKASSDANIIKTVSECRKILSDSELPEESYKILTDAGKDQSALLKQVASALLQSFICVILIIPFFYSSMHSVFFILISIPLSTLWTVCQLSALKLNINPDCIAGLSISIGLVSDPLLVIAEKAESKLCTGKSQFLQQVYLVIPAILFSTVTSLLALLPLFNAGYIIPGIRSIIITTGLMLCNSFIIAVVFFP
ncbi:MAG: efflux RND transporter permease subunit, partial [Treponema sp.]|nr:efflux RND transporter permease subunit [Treponema sp.]